MDPLRRGRSNHGSFLVDRKGTILGFDQAMETLTGWPAVEVVGRNRRLEGTRSRAGAADDVVARRPLFEEPVAVDPGLRNVHLTLHCRDGSRIDVEALAEGLERPADRALVTVLEILGRYSDPGDTLSGHRDPLTALPDRTSFASRLSAEVRAASLAASPLGLLVVDVDRLREVNDRRGRAAGDEVLRRIAGFLRVAVDDESRVARLGEDDFAVILEGAGRGDARQVAAGIRSAVERYRFFPDEGPRQAPQLTVSIGAASFPADADSDNELFARACEALEEARSMGRNRVWCYLRRPRVPLEVPVYFDGTDPLLVGYMRDLSPSGIFVETATTIDIGMRCALAFPLPGSESRVHVIGRVVRTVLAAEDDLDDGEERVPGIGIEFERFGGPGDRRAIDAFLHRHETLSRRPENGMLSL
jgi:diguanylate cyclase (GGDEF)-like protein